MSDRESVLEFWFGAFDEGGLALPEKRSMWWRKDEALDQKIREDFGALNGAALAGGLKSWQETPRGALAYIILLDQLTRNMHRGTVQMYAGDVLALEAARGAVERGDDCELPLDGRLFVYMPFMHSEALEDHRRCVGLFEGTAQSLSEPARASMEGSIKAAHQHRDIVARFGRFPHRNAILGRDSTPEEAEFLTMPGSSF